MICRVEGGYVASSNGVWIPGFFECDKTAKYAFRFSNEQLQRLQDEKNKTTNVITFEDLKKLKKELYGCSSTNTYFLNKCDE